MNFLDQLLKQAELTMEDQFELQKTRTVLTSSAHADVVDVAIDIYQLYLRQRKIANYLIKRHQEGTL